MNPYSAADIQRLTGSRVIEHTNARLGALRLRELLQSESHIKALGALTGNQAMQQVKAGLKAIYVSGWQVAADANRSGEMYPDQSLYPVDSVPALVRALNKTLQRCDQIQWSEGLRPGDVGYIDYYAPIVADAEAGFGGNLNTFELVKALIEAGAAAIHLEDQLSSAKKCGHMGGKVLVPTQEAIQKLIAARLAADVCGVPTVIIARTDADSATYLTSDIDERDYKFIENIPIRTAEGFYAIRLGAGADMAISRGLAYAPYADMIWCETGKPDIGYAKRFAEAIHAQYPGKWLAYNCSPSFNWRKNLTDDQIAGFQEELADMGYKFQFVTLAGFHSLNYAMFELAYDYKTHGMAKFAEMQSNEASADVLGFTAVKHQREVGAGYFDAVAQTISGATTLGALDGSTQKEQF